MTPHSWQQTDNYITWKFGENVTIKGSPLIIIFRWQKMAKSMIFNEPAFFD